MAINLHEFDLEIEKDFPPEFIAGDIITVDSQATIKEGDYVLDFKTSDVKQIKNKREL